MKVQNRLLLMAESAYSAASPDYSSPVWVEFKAAIREQYWLMLQDNRGLGVKLVSYSPEIDAVENAFRATKTLLVYEHENLVPGHPLAERSARFALTHNQLFRAVHDYYGHLLPGNDVSYAGELQAWLEHCRIFENAGHVEALKVLHAETLGQLARHYVTGKFEAIQEPKLLTWDWRRAQIALERER
jgi:hypothetical protein